MKKFNNKNKRKSSVWRKLLDRKKIVIPFVIIFAGVGGLLISRMFALTAADATHGGLFIQDQYFTAQTGGYTGIEVDMTPVYDVAAPDGYYYAQQGSFVNSGSGFYFGIQNNGSNPSGKIAIFSIWDAVAADGPQYHASFGGEGTGYSVRISYPWIAGRKYHLRVAKTSDNGSTSWWSGYIKDTATGVETYIGRIQISGNRGNIGSWAAIFHERYGGPTDNCNQPALSGVVFSNTVLMPGSVRPYSSNNTNSVNLSACPDYAYVRQTSSNRTVSYAGIKNVAARSLSIDAFGNGAQMDNYGRVWNLSPVDTKVNDDAKAPFWPNFDIARRLVRNTSTGQYYVLDGYGGIHEGGGAKPVTGASYWPNFDIARDIVITDWNAPAGYVLDGYGGLHAFGGAPALKTTAYWSGLDIAKRLVMNPSNTGGYVLEAWGGLHQFGAQAAAKGAPNWFGQDVARAVVLNPNNKNGYILDGSGAAHAFAVGSNSIPGAIKGTPYWSGNTSVAKDLVITNWTTKAGYELDYKGGVHAFGGAPAVKNAPYW